MLYNKEFHNLKAYKSPSVTRIVTSRRPCWARRVSRLRGTRKFMQNFSEETSQKTCIWKNVKETV
jgi:hypothetical protein